MKQQIEIKKETDFQKWLNDCLIFIGSKNVTVGKVYDGFAKIDGETVDSHIKTVYYDGEKNRLLAQSTDDNSIIVLKGRIYLYKNIVYAGEISCMQNSRTLTDLISDALKKTDGGSKNKKEQLLKALLCDVSPKTAYYHKMFYDIIADAYLNGYIC